MMQQTELEIRKGTGLKIALGVVLSLAGMAIITAIFLFFPLGKRTGVRQIPATTKTAQTDLRILTAKADALTIEVLNGRGMVTVDDKNKAATLEALKQSATQRQETLTQLAKLDPQQALLYFLPQDVRGTYPADVQPLIEEQMTGDGTSLVVHADYFDQGTSTTEYAVQIGSTTYQLVSAKNEDQSGTTTFINLSSNEKVHIGNAWKVGDVLLLPSDGTFTIMGQAAPPARTLTRAPHELFGIPTAQAGAENGSQKTLVLLANFTDDLSHPYPRAWAENGLFDLEAPANDNPDSVNALYKEFTDGLSNPGVTTDFFGDTYDWFTMDAMRDTIVCSPASTYMNYIRDNTIAKFVAFNPSVMIRDYARIVIGTPKTPCGFSGLSTLGQVWFSVPGQPDGGYASVSLLNSNFLSLNSLAGTAGHELGHGVFSMDHAQTYECGVNIISGTCSTIDYGEPISIMGPSVLYHPNTVHKFYGFFNLLSTRSQKVQQDGTYTLKPINYSAQGATMLEIPKRIDLSRNPPVVEWYYLTYRRPVREDGTPYHFENTPPPVTSGVYVYWNNQSTIVAKSLLLDMSPHAGGGTDWLDTTMQVGQTFTDPLSNTSFTLTNLTNTQATIQATNVPVTTCIRANPTVTVSPTSQVAGQGKPLAYTVTVTNNDNSLCAAAKFQFYQSVYPTGWTHGQPSIIQDVVPGETRTFTLTLTSQASTPPGTYAFTEKAHNFDYPSFIGSAPPASAIIVDQTAPTVALTTPANGAEVSGTIDIYASSGDNVGVVRTEIYRDGGTLLHIGPSYRFDTTTLRNGQHDFYAKAYDGSGNSTTSKKVMVNVCNPSGSCSLPPLPEAL